ncbi:MAG: hypothetical protein NW220_05845 [Leptolyngbyaceae cyanobacterium bins.349]|nr:hypothetical protein [Leptolyngbyaceae cyanobacterium bins.349]
MSGKRRVSAIHPSPDRLFNRSAANRPAKVRKPTSKELDLFLLAGCSCLLTLLYHPVAQALQSHSGQNSSTAIASQTSTAPTNGMNAFHLTLPSREEIKEEEE